MIDFLDQDQYSLTCCQFILEHYPDINVSYKFIDRNQTRLNHPDVFLTKLKSKINSFVDINLDMQFEQISYLRNFQFFKKWFLNYLKNYQFNPDQVQASIVNNHLQLEINGLWPETIFWEVPLLATITELYLEDKGISSSIDLYLEKIEKGLETLNGLNFIEFGTRRRHNFNYQDSVIKLLSEKSRIRNKKFKFLGTSNLHFAYKYGIASLGTLSHQIVMGVAAIEGFQQANALTMEKWIQTYQGRLGIALIDTFGTPAFLKDYVGVFPHLFKGLRQDSGDPIEIAKLIIEHCRKNDIPLEDKTIYFTDGLTPEKCRQIADHPALKGINISFGIGTFLTNDHPLNIVIKLKTCNGIPCIKLSDEPNKSFSGDITTLEYAKQLFASQ